MGLYEIIIAFFKKRIWYSLIEVLGLFIFFGCFGNNQIGNRKKGFHVGEGLISGLFPIKKKLTFF